MCTLTMPLDMEMVRGPSGVLFSGGPHLLGGPCRVGHLGSSKGGPVAHVQQQAVGRTGPVRPCLVAPQGLRPRGHPPKRVVFADARGLALTHVKVMTEPSCAPPRWTAAFLAQVTQGASTQSAPEEWEAQFNQPGADYCALRQTVQKQGVALESVAVRPVEKSIVGTIKVKNLAFHKEVFVRITFDSWNSQQDLFATYVPTGLPARAGTSALLDTFSFRTPLPPLPKLDRIELCLGFRCQGQEFWDNNNDNNYVLTKKPSSSSPDPHPNNQAQTQTLPLQYDALRLQLNTWTEFATWHHLVTDGPYW